MRFDLNEFLTSAKKPYTASFSMDLSGRDWPDYQVPAPVAGTFTVNRTLEGAQISLEAEAAVEAECARCLAPVHETYQIAQQYTVRPRIWKIRTLNLLAGRRWLAGRRGNWCIRRFF